MKKKLSSKWRPRTWQMHIEVISRRRGKKRQPREKNNRREKTTAEETAEREATAEHLRIKQFNYSMQIFILWNFSGVIGFSQINNTNRLTYSSSFDYSVAVANPHWNGNLSFSSLWLHSFFNSTFPFSFYFCPSHSLARSVRLWHARSDANAKKPHVSLKCLC